MDRRELIKRLMSLGVASTMLEADAIFDRSKLLPRINATQTESTTGVKIQTRGYLSTFFIQNLSNGPNMVSIRNSKNKKFIELLIRENEGFHYSGYGIAFKKDDQLLFFGEGQSVLTLVWQHDQTIMFDRYVITEESMT